MKVIVSNAFVQLLVQQLCDNIDCNVVDNIEDVVRSAVYDVFHSKSFLAELQRRIRLYDDTAEPVPLDNTELNTVVDTLRRSLGVIGLEDMTEIEVEPPADDIDRTPPDEDEDEDDEEAYAVADAYQEISDIVDSLFDDLAITLVRVLTTDRDTMTLQALGGKDMEIKPFDDDAEYLIITLSDDE